MIQDTLLVFAEQIAIFGVFCVSGLYLLQAGRMCFFVVFLVHNSYLTKDELAYCSSDSVNNILTYSLHGAESFLSS